MKKIFALVLVALGAVSFAQAEDFTVNVNTDNIYVGGSVGFWRNITEHTTEATIMPEVGYNINSKWAVGTTLGWEHMHRSASDYNMFAIAPYLRYNFIRAGKVTIFADGTVNVGLGRTSYSGGHDSDLAATYGIGVKPGISIKLDRHFSLVAHVGFVGYNGANKAARNGGAESGWGAFANGNNISFGAYYTF